MTRFFKNKLLHSFVPSPRRTCNNFLWCKVLEAHMSQSQGSPSVLIHQDEKQVVIVINWCLRAVEDVILEVYVQVQELRQRQRILQAGSTWNLSFSGDRPEYLHDELHVLFNQCTCCLLITVLGCQSQEIVPSLNSQFFDKASVDQSGKSVSLLVDYHGIKL